jgi:hypothetical protein
MAYGIGLGQFEPVDRLAERIDSLLSNPEPIAGANPWRFSWLLLILVPFLSLPLHLS